MIPTAGFEASERPGKCAERVFRVKWTGMSTSANEGSLRRSEPDASDVVGESPPSPPTAYEAHTTKQFDFYFALDLDLDVNFDLSSNFELLQKSNFKFRFELKSKLKYMSKAKSKMIRYNAAPFPERWPSG